MDSNNLKDKLKTEEENCTFLDSKPSLLMLSLIEPEVFVPNVPAIFKQQEPGVGFVIEPPIDEIGPRNQPFHRALINLENSLKQQSEEITKLISLLDENEMEEAYEVAMKLVDVVLDCKETKILNLKNIIRREQLNP